MKHLLLSFAVGISLLLLQACGGGGGGGGSSSSAISYSGLTTEARVEGSNAESLSTAAASGAAQSVVADSAGGILVPRSVIQAEAKLVEVSPRIAQWIVGASNLYSAKTVVLSGEICDAGGTAIADTNDAETVGTIVFTNCGILIDATEVIYLTGTVDYVITLAGGAVDSLSMTFNVTATYAGESAALNLSLNCVDLSGSASCTVRSDFVGVDGRIYRVMDITVTPSGSGYYVNATVYDPDHGRVDMTTTAPLAFDCPNGVPSTGTVVISGTDSTSGTINLVSCSEFNVTVDGVSNTYYWP